MTWKLMMRGGAYDKFEANTHREPQPICVLWRCEGISCDGHASFDPMDPRIVARTAEAYKRVDVNLAQHEAVYEVGQHEPDRVSWRKSVWAHGFYGRML